MVDRDLVELDMETYEQLKKASELPVTTPSYDKLKELAKKMGVPILTAQQQPVEHIDLDIKFGGEDA
jgi:hypothetical protein